MASSWELVPCGVRLRSEVNALAPNRDKTTDGTIGDSAHQLSLSDHNDDEVGRVPIRDADSKHEVHAWDADKDLRQPGLTMEMVVQHVLERCRSGAERRLRYVIYNRRIWEASNGWRQRKYTGDSPHTEHAHFSFSYVTALEASTASWHLEDIPVALTEADLSKIAALIKTEVASGVSALRAEVNAVPAEGLAIKIGDKANLNRSVGDALRDGAKLRGVLVGDDNDTKNAAVPANAPLTRIIAAADVILRQEASKSPE